MSYTEIFYWLTVADNAKTFFGTFAIFFCILFVIIQIVRFIISIDDSSNIEEKDFYTRVNN